MEDMKMDLTVLLKDLCGSFERRDGTAFAALFTEDGVFHDVLYGAFEGRAKIAEMVDDRIPDGHARRVRKVARDFRWEMFRPVSDGRTLYAYYTFSFVSTLPAAKGKRVGWDGVSIMTLRDGKIAEYREVANSSISLLEIGFAPERIAKILAKEAKLIKARPEWKRHED